MSYEDEDVDAFGRTISRDRRVSGDNEDSRHNRELERSRRSESPTARYGRDDYRNRRPQQQQQQQQQRPYHNGPRDYQPHHHNNAYPRDRGFNNNHNNNGPRYDDRRSFQPREPRGPPPPPTPPTTAIAPFVTTPSQVFTGKNQLNVERLLSFKSFVNQQNEDQPPEAFNAMYANYNLEYLQYFSDCFFKKSLAEEWFQDRYNPVHIEAIEKETETWAAEESRRFKELLLNQTEEFIRACSLDPGSGKKKSTFGEDMVERTVVDFGGRHLAGHEHRTLYLTEIHAGCSKSVLKAAIIEVLTNKSTEVLNLIPERILIAQPVWNNKNIEKFERTAWVVMPSVAAAKEAQLILKDFEVKIPDIPDLDKEEAPILDTFKLQCTIHTPRSLNDLPDNFSGFSRVRADILRATKLATLLDEDRSVPAEDRLENFLFQESVMNQITKPTEHLDVCIAYLRRVHFLAFYGGKRFRDESHLLAMSSSVAYRSKPYLPTKEEGVYNMRTLSVTAADSNAVVVAAMEEDDKVENDDGDNVQDAAETKEDLADTTTASAMDTHDSNSPAVAMTPNKAKPTKVPVDKKIAPMIADLEQRVALKKRRQEDASIPGLQDEEDAKVILAAQEQTFEALVYERCINGQDKCRCCFTWCNKLFKASSFLLKHLKTKHEGFGLAEIVKDAEVFMRKRYEAEAIDARPLPPIELEAGNGVELKSVRAILDKYSAAVPPTLGLPPPPTFTFKPPSGNNNYNNNNNNNNQRRSFGGNDDRRYDHHHHNSNYSSRFSGGGDRDRDSFSGRKRKSDDFRDNSNKDRRVNIDEALPTSNSKPRFSEGNRFSDSHIHSHNAIAGERKMATYIDVDAPKESVVAIDYGVAVLPPVKKRKFGAVTPSKAAVEQPAEASN